MTLDNKAFIVTQRSQHAINTGKPILQIIHLL